jgi:tRNA(Ile)-lysidine synthase
MNADRRFARVRARDELLPRLREENPAIDAALIRLAAHAREALAGLSGLDTQFPIDCAALAAQPAAVRKRVLAAALAGIDVSARHLDALDRLVTAPTAGTVSLDLPGATIARTYDVLDRAEARGPRPEARPPAPAGYTWRTYQPGDRMRPARLKGRSRKLSDLYTDAKVPRNRRALAHVLLRQLDGSIAWAEHVGRAFDAPDDLVPR